MVSIEKDAKPRGVGGWLLGLCLLLMVWGPIELALLTSTALAALPVRGASLGWLIVARLGVAAFGVAAGLALIAERGPAVSMARASIALTAALNVFVYATPYFPNNRAPGDDVFYIAGTVAYAVIWLVYLARSRRVRNTYA